MQTGCSLVLAELFDRLNGDYLLVHLDALCCQSVSDLLGGNSTEDLAVLVSLGGNVDYSCSEFLSQSLSVSQEFGELVSLLLEVLGELLAVALVGDDSQLVRQQVVTAVTVAYLNDIVFVAQVGYVLNQNDFHNLEKLKIKN